MKAEIIKANGERFPAIPKKGKSFSYEELRAIVGGTIDIQRLPKTGGRMIVNDNGKLEGMPVNGIASQIWRENYPIEKYPFNNDGTIVGDVLICDGRMVR